MDKIIDRFDFGIDNGNYIEDTDLIWITSERGMQVRSLNDDKTVQRDKQVYHKFDEFSTEKYKIITSKEFKYSNQLYLLVSLNFNNNPHRNILCVFNVQLSKVICAFTIHFKVISIDIHVNENNAINNVTRNFSSFIPVTAFCGCIGGALFLVDITPRSELLSNEHSPLELCLYEANEDINESLENAVNEKKVFAVLLNDLCLKDEHFLYTMPDDQLIATIPLEQVKISALKYEKQMDSLLVGFNFGCFQIWNMKTLCIESSSVYANLTRPIIGFSLLEPQNDPRKCLYLLIAHSSLLNCTYDSTIGDEEIDNDDDNESDSSFIVLYQLNYEKKILVQNIDDQQATVLPTPQPHNDLNYYLYEGLTSCDSAFEQDLTLNTLKHTNLNKTTSYDYEQNNDTDDMDDGEYGQQNENEKNLSKIISIRTLKVRNNDIEVDICAICWTTNSKFYLTLFNLNIWYSSQMPIKINKFNKNPYLTSYPIHVDLDCATIKFMHVIDTKIKKLKSSNDESMLSIYLDLVVLSSFMLIKYTIKPVEEQIHEFLNKQEDVFKCLDKIFSMLNNYNLLNSKNLKKTDKLLTVFEYLLDNSELYLLLRSIKKLETIDTSIISSYSLKTVLDWTWSKFKELKYQLSEINKSLIDTIYVFNNNQSIQKSINKITSQLKNLIKIYELFIQLNQTPEGFVELNKKLKVISSFHFYSEHLVIFLDYNLLPEKMDEQSNTSKSKLFAFSILKDFWHERRKNNLFSQNKKYQYTFMIDSLINECKNFSLVSKFLKQSMYPPKSSFDILELLIECNLTNDIKQMIFLYFLIDLKHNVSDVHVQMMNHLVEYYCKIHLTNSNLFSLVYGFYLLDIHDIKTSYNHIRNCDMNSLEIHEKYRILFNLAHLNKWSEALEYLWFFNDILNIDGKSTSDVELNEIHSKLLIDIYLANKLVNEAYETVKVHSDNRFLYKKLVTYFLVQSETFNVWKHVLDLFIANQQTLPIVYNYLEAKQDINSICTAIDLYLNNQYYTNAIQLYEKYARQINQSFPYITSMIDVVREMSNERQFDMKQNQQNSINITINDIKDAKNNLTDKLITINTTKRCKIELDEASDAEHIRLLQLIELNYVKLTETPRKQLITPSKAQGSSGSILKTTTNSTATTNNRNVDGSKSVKFKLIQMLTNNDDMDENMDIMQGSPATSSVMSTISSKSGLNLQSRLKDLEKDEDAQNAENLNKLIESDVTSNLLKKTNSVCSTSSTISIQSSANLAKRLNELENDVEELERTEVVQQTPKVMFNLDSVTPKVSMASMVSACSITSTASIASIDNLEKRLEEVKTPLRLTRENTIPYENGALSTQTSMSSLSQPCQPVTDAAYSNVSISSCASLSIENLDRRLEEVKTPCPTLKRQETIPYETMEGAKRELSFTTQVFLPQTTPVPQTAEDSRMEDTECVTMQDDSTSTGDIEEQRDKEPTEAKEPTVNDSTNENDENANIDRSVSGTSGVSAMSTMSSKSAQNIDERLHEFDNNDANEKTFTENEVVEKKTNVENSSVIFVEEVYRYEIDLKVTTSQEQNDREMSFQENVEPKKSETLETSQQSSVSLHVSMTSFTTGATNQATTTEGNLQDEHIGSVSDNELGDSPTSVYSQCSQYTATSEVHQNDKTLENEDQTPQKAKPKATVKRRSSNRLTKPKLDLITETDVATSLTPGPLTRSKLKALAHPKQSDDNEFDEIRQARTTRATRSVTNSPPSPTSSIASSASTTLARNTLKRRGSNRIKKPAAIISPPSLAEIEDAENPNARYNLRSRKTPQKSDAESDTYQTPKKTRRIAIKKPASLYKIDETATADATANASQAFSFSQPNNFNFNTQNSDLVNVNSAATNSEDDGDASFTFSPPQSSTKKK